MMRRASLLGAAVLMAVTTACTGTGPSPTASTFPTGSAATVGPGPSSGPPPEITLAFAGDVHFTQRTLRLLDDPQTAFGPVAAVLRGADLAMVNLETAVTTRGTPEPKRFHFRAPPIAYQAIKAAGIDVVTIANNHALDYGRVGLADTLASARAAGVPTVGAGSDAAEAYRAWITTIRGVRIGIVGMSQVAELSSSWAARDDRSGIAMAFDTARAVAAVRAARAAADVVVVYLHWGQEYNQCPTAAMRSLARRLADAGAAVIVGTHAHVLLGDGWLGGTYVAYGMSNFLWWYNDAGSNDTGVIRLTLRGASRGVAVVRTEFVPAYIDRITGQPVPSVGKEATRISAKFAGLRSCTGLAAAPS